MAVVTLNEPAIDELLFRPTGPVARMIMVRAAAVEAIARENASGPVIGIRTGDLLDGLSTHGPDFDAAGMFVTVGTNARHRGFAYPTFHDRNATPRGRWLTEALSRVFSGAGVAV